VPDEIADVQLSGAHGHRQHKAAGLAASTLKTSFDRWGSVRVQGAVIQ
jgi:hypothetical protein